MRRTTTFHLAIVLAAAASMLTIPMTALASHNSAGANVYLAQADEHDGDGGLAADVPPDSPYAELYHENLDVPRAGPPDQTGDRYTDCTKAGETSAQNYRDGLETGESCYVGFLDHQWEYFLWWNRLFYPKQSTDLLYPANPEPENDFCQDPQNRLEPECSGDGHTWFVPGDVAVDTNLMETPMEDGAGPAPGVADVSGTDDGSGVLTFPLETTPYVFLFGQPHPDNEDPSGFEAGSGPFGPDPAEGGSPLFDISGACGDRTLECTLLTPEDLLLYDENTGGLGDVEGFGSQARLCAFRPQFVTVNPDARDAGLCGVFGSVVNSFFPTTEAGGFGVPGASSTWAHTQPGWFEATLIYPESVFVPGVALLPAGEAGTLLDVADEPIADGEITDALDQYVAVNPHVPTDTHPLWCVRPNMLSTGTGESIVGVGDPGLYGPYVADAIDTDAFVVSPLLETYEEAIGTVHPVTKPLYDAAVGLAEGATEDLNELLDEADVPPEVQQALTEATDRANYLESGEPPEVTTPFEIEQPAGIACDAQGVVQAFETPRTVDGGVAMDTNVVVSRPVTGGGEELKDPTLTTDGLPAGESETWPGAWQTDWWTFDGSIAGFLDTSEDADEEPGAQFDGCASANGQPQPNNDFCTWEPLWDAYNPECRNLQGDTCGSLLEGQGYDLDEGVGVYFSVKVSGPVLVADEDTTDGNQPRPDEVEDRTALLGLEDPTAQNCIVGFSVGLPDALGETATEATVDEACQATDGERYVVEDGLDDQSATGSPGEFSAAIRWLKAAPTPSAVIDATEIGAGDELCVTMLWNVQEGEVADDTAGSLELTGAGSPHTWSQCYPFEASIK